MQSIRIIVTALSLGGTAGAQLPLPPPVPKLPPQNCTAAEHRQLDFWVGNWNVYRTGTLEMVGGSTVERVYGDCAIREEWHPFDMNFGGSLSNFVTAEGRWRQSWLDSQNSRIEYVGGMAEEKVVLTGTAMNGSLSRVSLWREDKNVRQVGERSTDGGRLPTGVDGAEPLVARQPTSPSPQVYAAP